MPEPHKSFFSSLTGLITGIAGLLTAIVAVLGIAGSQGWLSSASHSKSGSAVNPNGTSVTSTSSTSSTSTTFGSGATSNSVGGVPQYDVNPTSIVFQPLGPTTAVVNVNNTGLVPLTVEPPQVSGPDASHFTAADQNCGSNLDPGRSCQLQVTFKPVPGTFNATLVVQVVGAPRATEVRLQASAVL